MASSDSGMSGDGGDAPAPAAAEAAAEWGEWSEPDESDATRSLFSGAVLPSPEAALAHDAAQHGFDLVAFRAALALDDHDTFRVINYIRCEVAEGRDPRPALAAAAARGAAPGSAAPWAGDGYLAPALEDDPLLGYDFDDDAAAAGWAAAGAAGAVLAGLGVAATDAGAVGVDEDGTAAGTSAGPSGTAGSEAAASVDALAALRAENAALRTRLAALVEATLPAELLAGGAADAALNPLQRGGPGDGGPSTSGSGSDSDSGNAGGGSTRGRAMVVGGKQRRGGAARVDAAYFESYSYFDIHREMLGDVPRTEAYRDALEANPALLRGARVLDVGCGTGILSMFAARAGAAAVVGLDASERIAGFARQNVEANKLARGSGGVVDIVTGRVEAVTDIGLEQVDVIVSEWMGYALLFESMLDSVLTARDRWLRPGGAVLPDLATIHITGATDEAMGLDFWQDVYGFSMEPIGRELRSGGGAGSVLVRQVGQAALATAPARVHHMDIATMAPSDQDFTAEFTLAAAGGGGGGGAASMVTCVVLWFDVEFSARFCAERPVTLSTAPAAPATHWVQAVLPLRQGIPLAAGGALAGRISMARSAASHRGLDISLEVGPAGCGGPDPTASRQVLAYNMQVGGGGD